MEIDFSLWETPKLTQKKILGVGYSSTYLSNEDKNTLSYKMWMKMIHKCYSESDYNKKLNDGKNPECCNSWLDYQNFLRWFNKNYIKNQSISMFLTKHIISKDNIIYNPNNCAIVPKAIFDYLERAYENKDRAKELAETYKEFITEDIYELLTEDY